MIFSGGVSDPAKGIPSHAFGMTNQPDELLPRTL